MEQGGILLIWLWEISEENSLVKKIAYTPFLVAAKTSAQLIDGKTFATISTLDSKSDVYADSPTSFLKTRLPFPLLFKL